MRITKRQLRRIIKETITESQAAGPPIPGMPSPKESPDAWANKHGGDVERDEDDQTIIYLSKEDYPSDRDVMGMLPPGWDYEDTYDGTSWVIYTGLYPGGRSVYDA